MMKSMLNIRLLNKAWLLTIGFALFLMFGSLIKPVQAAEGDVWITPANTNANTNQNFDIEVLVDTGGKDIGAFNMYLDFDPAQITIDTTQGIDPTKDSGRGFDKGSDTSDYIMMSNSNDIANGHFRFAGITATNYANGSDQHLIIIHAKTKVAGGSTNLSLRVNELSDELGHALATGTVVTGASVTITDTTAPTLAEVTPVPTPTNDTTPDYTFSSDEAGTITYGGGCGSATSSAVVGNNTITFNSLTEGTHNCTITVTDGAGNVSSVLNVTAFTIDTTAPTLAEVTLVPTPTNDDTPDYTFSSDEAGTITYGGDCSSSTTSAVSGNNTITFNSLSAGTHSNCTITVTDSAGNTSGVLNVSSFEVVVPVITEVTPIATPSNNTTPTYVYSAANLNSGTGTADWGGSCDGYFAETTDGVGSGNNSATATSAMPEGTYSDCTLTVNDGTRDSNTLNIPSFTIDTTAPTLAEVTPVPTPTNDTTPDYTFSSDEAGTITYGGGCGSATSSAVVGNNTITFNSLAEGTHNCTITVTDGAGNVSNVLNVTAFTIDTTAPTLAEVTLVPTPTNDDTPDYTFSSDEAGTITYGGDCSSSTTSAVSGNNTITFNSLSAGTHSNCTITVTDSAGNTSGVLNVSSFETTTPTCTGFTYSAWGACQPDNKQTRTVTATTPTVCIGGSPVLEQSCTYVSNKDLSKAKIEVKIKSSRKKYKLRKKKTVYLRKRKLSFKGKNSDIIGGKVQLFVDGKLKGETTVGADGAWKLSKKIKKNGRHKIRFKYFDGTGNFLGQSRKYKVKIDTRKPKFVNLPSFLTKRVGDKVVFKATDKKRSNKAKGKIKYYKYYFLGKKHKTKKPELVIPAGTSRGLHTLKVRAYDKAGNKVTKIVVVKVK